MDMDTLGYLKVFPNKMPEFVELLFPAFKDLLPQQLTILRPRVPRGVLLFIFRSQNVGMREGTVR